jgi:hypothetical protein
VTTKGRKVERIGVRCEVIVVAGALKMLVFLELSRVGNPE